MDTTENQYNGFYRALTVDNKDPEVQGRVKIWIPDVMPKVDQSKGLWARPANNIIGGRNSDYDQGHTYMGSSYIPKKGSWLWIFFEKGELNSPWYLGGCNLGNTKVLPENQLGKEKEHKWVIFKSHEGRCVVVSDDPDDRRVEITGKKRNISNSPTGDTGSVYPIDGNQSTILFDERQGKEKILIRTYKGDYLHIDVDEQKLQSYFKSDIILKTEGNFHLSVGGNTYFENKGSLNIKCGGALVESVGGEISVKSGGGQNIKSAVSYNVTSGASMNYKAGGILAQDGPVVLTNMGASSPAITSSPQAPKKPKGERDT